jgi:hypothetical protein
MLNKSFDSEKAIKTWAIIFYYAAKIIAGAAILTALILLMVDADDLWWASLVTLAGGAIVAASNVFFAHMIWGFGEIVGNTKKIASGSTESKSNFTDDTLPDL